MTRSMIAVLTVVVLTVGLSAASITFAVETRSRLDDANDKIAELEIDLINVTVSPPITDTEGDAWACATAWGSLSEDDLDYAFAERPLPRLPGHAAPPKRILDLIDQFCYDGSPP